MQPTPDVSRSADAPRIAALLGRLLKVCRDGANGYRHVAKDARDNRFREIFTRLHLEREEQVLALKDLLFRFGAERIDDGGSLLGALHGGIIDARAGWTGGNPRILVNECLRGDRAAIRAYEAALAEEGLPAEVVSTLTRHHGLLRRSDTELEALLAEL